MKLAAWMILGSLAPVALVTGFGATDAVREVWLGMLGPAIVAAFEWVVVERAFRRNPGSLTAVMIRLFAGKMIFFADYVGLLLGTMALEPVPFVVSFVGCFVGLLVVEAVFLGRLTSGLNGGANKGSEAEA